MKIAFDAYFLSKKQNTGIGNVVINLLLELSRIDNVNHYYLYTPFVEKQTEVFEILKNKNFHLVEIKGMFHKWRRLWLQQPSLLKQINNDGIDFFFGGGEYLPVLLSRKIITAVTVHDAVFRIFPETIPFINGLFYKILFPFSMKRTDYIFTISSNSRKEIVDYLNPGNKKIFVIPDGIDLAKYKPESKIKKGNYILFVGTVQPRKNILNLLRAYVSIADKIKENLVIIGASGWKNSNIAGYVESLPEIIKNRIYFKGFISDTELVKYYREARLFVAPSIHEGFGMIILEAMASGAPVISSPVGAIKEFFSGAVELVDPYSPADIAEKIVMMLKSRSKSDKAVKKGYQISKKFSSLKMAKGYLDIFNSIAVENGLQEKTKKSVLQITAGEGGEFEMVRRIDRLFSTNQINSKILTVKTTSGYESLNSNKVFDEDFISLRSFFSLRQHVNKCSIVFYHYISSFSSLFIISFIKLFCAKQIAGIFHSNLTGPGSWMKKALYLIRKFFVINCSVLVLDRMVFVSNAQMLTFKNMCIFKKKFNRKYEIINNFVFSKKITSRYQKNSDMLRILFIGRLSHFKGFHDFLELLNHFKDDKRIEFIIIGDGYLRHLIPARKNVVYAGTVRNEDIYKFYDKSNVLILPSYTECFPLIFLEAMARGLLIMASDIPTIREIVIDRENGFLFKAGDVENMKKIINIIREDNNVWTILKNNRKKINFFTETVQGKKYLDLFNNLVNRE